MPECLCLDQTAAASHDAAPGLFCPHYPLFDGEVSRQHSVIGKSGCPLLDEMNANDDELGTIELDHEIANSEHVAAQAHLDELESRYGVDIIDRSTWGAQEPADDDDWYDYPTTTPLKDQLDSIVVHHTADPQDQTVQELEEKERDAGYSDMPYHFVITQDGSIYEGRETGSMGAHAGIGLSPGVDNDPDKGRIGIVLTGDMERDFNTPFPDSPTDAQVNSLKALSGHLCREYDIDASDILKHSEVPNRGGDSTVCPGQNLAPKVEEIRDELGTELPTYDEDLRAAHDSVNDLGSKIDALEGRQIELDERNEKIRERLDDLSSRRDDLIGERDAHQASKDELESAMEDRAGKIGDLQSEINELSGEIKSLEATRDAARSEGKAHRQDARDHQAEVDSRVEERTNLREQRDALQSRIDELDGEIDAKQSRIEELDAEVGEAWDIGDEQTQDTYELIFDVTYEDPWTLVSEELEDGMWTVGKLKANPNGDCEVCGAHIGEEYPFDEPGAPYHPNCDCVEEQVLQDISAR